MSTKKRHLIIKYQSYLCELIRFTNYFVEKKNIEIISQSFINRYEKFSENQTRLILEEFQNRTQSTPLAKNSKIKSREPEGLHNT